MRLLGGITLVVERGYVIRLYLLLHRSVKDPCSQALQVNDFSSTLPASSAQTQLN